MAGPRGARCVDTHDLRRRLAQLLVESRHDPERTAIILRYDAHRPNGLTDVDVAGSAPVADVCARVDAATWLLVADVAGISEAIQLVEAMRANLGPEGVLDFHLAHPWRDASELMSDVLGQRRAFPPRPREPQDR
ncbi:MAG TPA: hypothetical protein VFX33_06940 [Actinomycetales bacterium]|nr:hypothetical protein [Actinomycetales bacterium]